MNALQAAVDSNNVGVSLLETARYDEALDVFRSAADLMYVVTQVVHAANPEAVWSASTSDPSTCRKVNDAQEKMLKFATSTKKENQQPLGRRHDVDCFLHVRAFNLSMPACTDDVDCALHSATILANMALTYHLAVPQTASSNFPSFNSAMTLYEMAYSVASRLEHSEQSSQIMMVTLNNMGQIYHECGSYDEARSILNTLQPYIRHRIKAGDEDFSAEKRMYLLNAMLLVKPGGAAAA